MFSERTQLLAGSVALESMACVFAGLTINLVESGNVHDPAQVIIGALGSIAAASSGGFLWHEYHKQRTKQ